MFGSWKKKVEKLERVCSRINGVFIDDADAEDVFSCVVSDRGFTLAYFRKKDLFVSSLSSDGMVMSISTKELPEFSVSGGEFSVHFDKPVIARAYTVDLEE